MDNLINEVTPVEDQPKQQWQTVEEAYAQPVRLNLGCGRKLFHKAEGWINIDIVAPKESIPGEAIFVEDDIRSLLKFENDSVDEIHAYHVIEHFAPYEIEPMLTDWFRVLKPGGLLVLEQPDIIKACINVLQSKTTKEMNLHFNLGLLGIYGEQDPDNPYMAHRWGWEFETLAQFVENVGFVNTQELPAQTHMKEARDFRLEATKPQVDYRKHTG